MFQGSEDRTKYFSNKASTRKPLKSSLLLAVALETLSGGSQPFGPVRLKDGTCRRMLDYRSVATQLISNS